MFLMDEWISKTLYLHMLEYYLAFKKEILTHAAV